MSFVSALCVYVRVYVHVSVHTCTQKVGKNGHQSITSAVSGWWGLKSFKTQASPNPAFSPVFTSNISSNKSLHSLLSFAS